jgi:hypothetical protein
MDAHEVPEHTERQRALFAEKETPKILRHYTQLPAVLKILGGMELRLNNTENFSDPKDREWTNYYKIMEPLKRKNLYAICFAWETELVHHWNTYAPPPYGCCIAFDGPALAAAAGKAGIRHRRVRYLRNIGRPSVRDAIPPKDYPFSKGWAYRSEHEYRVVSETKRALPLRKEWIYRVTVSSKMNNNMFDYFKKAIKKEHGIDLSHSTFEKDD